MLHGVTQRQREINVTVISLQDLNLTFRCLQVDSQLLISVDFSVLVESNHCDCPIQLQAQLSLPQRTVSVDHQSESDVGILGVSDDLDMAAAIELAFIFNDRADERELSHLRIVQPMLML